MQPFASDVQRTPIHDSKLTVARELWCRGACNSFLANSSEESAKKDAVTLLMNLSSTCQVDGRFPTTVCIQSLPSGVIKHGVLENGSLIGDFPIETSMHGGFSLAMFDYQRVSNIKLDCLTIDNRDKSSYWIMIILSEQFATCLSPWILGDSGHCSTDSDTISQLWAFSDTRRKSIIHAGFLEWLEWGYPINGWLKKNGVILLKWMIWGYPHFNVHIRSDWENPVEIQTWIGNLQTQIELSLSFFNTTPRLDALSPWRSSQAWTVKSEVHRRWAWWCPRACCWS